MATQHKICVCATTLCSNIVPMLSNQNLPVITVYFDDKQLTTLIDTQVPLIDYDLCQTFLAREPPPVQFSNKSVPAVACIEGTVKGSFRFHEHDNTPLMMMIVVTTMMMMMTMKTLFLSLTMTITAKAITKIMMKIRCIKVSNKMPPYP